MKSLAFAGLLAIAFGATSFIHSATAAQPSPQTAAVVSKNHSIDYKTMTPQKLTVATGDTISIDVQFKGNPGLFDPSRLPQAVSTDGKVGVVLEMRQGGPRRKTPDILEAWQLTAVRPGTAEIRFIDFNGKNVATVNVTVVAGNPQQVQHKSGVEGVAFHHPVFGNRPTHPVPAQPQSGAVIIARDAKSKKEIARTTADKDGKFQLALPAGKYILESGLGTHWVYTQKVKVVSGHWSKVRAEFTYNGPPIPRTGKK